jgi:regulatory protein
LAASSDPTGSGPVDRTLAAGPGAAPEAWRLAVRVLAAHDRSEQELRARLAARQVPASDIDDTVRRLHALGYLDDRRFAASTAEHAARRGYGSERVRAALRAKGVDETLAAAALAAAYADEAALARRVLARRFGTETLTPATHAAAHRHLRARGFPEPVVLAILGEGC